MTVLSGKCLTSMVARKNPPISKNNIAAQLRLVDLKLRRPQDFWINVIWTENTNVEMFGHNAQHQPNTAYQDKLIVVTVKHGGGGVIIWACFATT